jgi:hypothetical protein
VDARVLRWTARAASVLVALGMVLVLVVAAREADITGSVRSVDWVSLVESTIQTLVFGGITILFLQALPDRLERRQLLRQLHRLRSLAHVIDMHQLTKDPERLRRDFQPTEETVASRSHEGPDAALSRLLLRVVRHSWARSAALCGRGVPGLPHPRDRQRHREPHDRNVAQDLAEDHPSRLNLTSG